MRAISTTLGLLLLVAPATASEDTTGGSLSDSEREELLQLLDDSQRDFLSLIDGLSAEQWSYKPTPDRWSVGECAEHIVLSERALFEAAKTALAKEPDPEWAEKTKGKAELLKRVMPNRNPGGAGGAQAPQEIRPHRDLNRDQVTAELATLRAEIHDLVDSLDRPIKEYTEEHPFPIFGTLSAYDWLLYVPLHTIRHSKQIVEVQESPDYPAAAAP